MVELDSKTSRRTRALRRRIVVGTLVVIGGLWLVWDSWGLSPSGFLEALGMTAVFVIILAVPGAIAGVLLGWVRRRTRRRREEGDQD